MNIGRLSFVNYANLNKPQKNKNAEIDESKEKAKKIKKEETYTTLALGEEGGDTRLDVFKY